MNLAPAPWNLTGEAFISVFKFSKEFVNEHCFMADYQTDNWRGSLGAVMLVNYKSSNVGPYFELLFIPGKIELGHLKSSTITQISGFTISKIYVSTMASVENGINNWGIPKELADFQWNNIGTGAAEITVSKDGLEFFKAVLKQVSFAFPITTSILPLKIIQKFKDKYYLTKPKASGKGSFARLKSVAVNSKYFPDICCKNSLATFHLNHFEMIFPIPAIFEKE